MTDEIVIFLVIVIIAGIALLRIIARIFLKLIILLIMAGIILYLVFFYNGGIV
jgi:hypothetical protein